MKVAYPVDGAMAMGLHRLVELGDGEGHIMNERPELRARVASQSLRHWRNHRLIQVIVPTGLSKRCERG